MNLEVILDPSALLVIDSSQLDRGSEEPLAFFKLRLDADLDQPFSGSLGHWGYWDEHL